MKLIEQRKVFFVNSEPGDGTRYNYVCWEEGGVWMFRKDDNTFEYPEYIRPSVVKELLKGQPGFFEQDINTQRMWMMDKVFIPEGVNHCTYRECLHTMALKMGLIDALGRMR